MTQLESLAVASYLASRPVTLVKTGFARGYQDSTRRRESPRQVRFVRT